MSLPPRNLRHPGRPWVKVCCIQSREEARIAAAAGASALGLVGPMPSGPGILEESVIAGIAADLPPGLDSFLLTSRTDADAILDQHRRCGTSTLQLCAHLDAEVHRRLRAALPETALVQVVHMPAPGALDYARSVAAGVDALLLDSGRPDLPVPLLGGTGRTHDWSLSRRLREWSPVPVLLAGGLESGNVRDAVRAVDPAGLDVCSGVRSGGRLDAARLAAFLGALAGDP